MSFAADDPKHKERLAEIGKTANILAHEIRNSLTVITNAMYIIKKYDEQKTDPVSMRTPVKIVENELKTMDKIVNDMLSFARSRQPVISSIDLAVLFDEITGSLPKKDGVVLEVIKKDIPAIDADKEEIKQVFRNLINNAIDSLSTKEKGSIKISLSPSKIVTNNLSADSVQISISDNGCGMNSSQKQKLFRPFFSTKSKGTGLGLVVVKRIVEERHNGTIIIDTIEGKGTTVVLNIPIKYNLNNDGGKPS